MKFKRILLASACIITFSSLFSMADIQHPSHWDGYQPNKHIDKGSGTLPGSWTLKNVKYYNDEYYEDGPREGERVLNWANYGCDGDGNGCKRGDWVTVWTPDNRSQIQGPGEERENWIWNSTNGRWEPPYPSEAGTWQRIYPTGVNYNELTGIYE